MFSYRHAQIIPGLTVMTEKQPSRNIAAHSNLTTPLSTADVVKDVLHT